MIANFNENIIEDFFLANLLVILLDKRKLIPPDVALELRGFLRSLLHSESEQRFCFWLDYQENI